MLYQCHGLPERRAAPPPDRLPPDLVSQARQEVLVGPAAARCRELSEAQGAERGWTLLALALQPDHLDLFTRVWPSDRSAELVKAGKRSMSCALRTECAP